VYLSRALFQFTSEEFIESGVELEVSLLHFLEVDAVDLGEGAIDEGSEEGRQGEGGDEACES
jgi:hypothetical protein